MEESNQITTGKNQNQSRTISNLMFFNFCHFESHAERFETVESGFQSFAAGCAWVIEAGHHNVYVEGKTSRSFVGDA